MTFGIQRKGAKPPDAIENSQFSILNFLFAPLPRYVFALRSLPVSFLLSWFPYSSLIRHWSFATPCDFSCHLPLVTCHRGKGYTRHSSFFPVPPVKKSV
jgi:hypothetical protein